jgi:hypothetical protein
VVGTVVGLILAGIAAAAASAGPPSSRPPTLTGEQLQDDVYTITASCNPSGTSTISFHAGGTASSVSPYTGTFSEDGTITIGPQNGPPNSEGVPTGQVLSFSATFTIDAGSSQVSGTDTFSPSRKSQAVGVCNDNVTLTNVLNAGITASGRYRYVLLSGPEYPGYTAAIQAPQGSFGDLGTAETMVEDIDVTDSSTGTSYGRYGFVQNLESKSKSVKNG